MAILTVENLTKDYGNIKALKGVSFSVPKGTVFGILGPNGSGKTTLLGIVMDVLKASGGHINYLMKFPQKSIVSLLVHYWKRPIFIIIYLPWKTLRFLQLSKVVVQMI
jgi:ABC-type multidrug transport system ATPase subunit